MIRRNGDETGRELEHPSNEAMWQGEHVSILLPMLREASNDGPGVPDTIGYREVSHLHASTNRDLEVVWVRGLLEEDRFRTRLPPSLETP